MSDKPTALRLADELDKTLDFQNRAWSAAKELRRLHDEVEALRFKVASLEAGVGAAARSNDALRDENKVLQDSCEAKADRIDRLGESVERDTALLRQALEALSQAVKLANATGWSGGPKTISTITALRQRLGDKP